MAKIITWQKTHMAKITTWQKTHRAKITTCPKSQQKFKFFFVILNFET
jgi:hypothetical protein